MLHCLHSVLWLEFSVWGSSDKLSAAPRPKNNNLASSVHKILSHFSLGQSMCILWQIVILFHFFNNGTLRGLLADSLASHRRLLIVTVLTGNFRLSLITLELIINWVFAILAILRSIRMVVFHFLLHLSGFGCHLKAFDIILAEQPIIFCTSLCFPLSNQLFNQSTLFFWTMSGTTHLTQIFREKCTVQHLLLYCALNYWKSYL